VLDEDDEGFLARVGPALAPPLPLPRPLGRRATDESFDDPEAFAAVVDRLLSEAAQAEDGNAVADVDALAALAAACWTAAAVAAASADEPPEAGEGGTGEVGR